MSEFDVTPESTEAAEVEGTEPETTETEDEAQGPADAAE